MSFANLKEMFGHMGIDGWERIVQKNDVGIRVARSSQRDTLKKYQIIIILS